MEGRTSLCLFALAFAITSSGCVSTGANKDILPIGPASTAMTKMTDDPARVTKKEDGPKRKAQPATEIASGKFMEAEADTDAVKKNPEAQAQLRDNARKAYQAALQTDPNNLEASKHLAKLYVKVGDYDRAFEIYKKSMAKHPKDAGLWYDLGLCHHRRKDFNESLRCFAKAIELEPENRDYMKKLGFTLAWMGDIEKGYAYLARAQGAPMAHCNIARILIERNQPQAAREHVMAALRDNRDLPDANGLLAWLDNPTTRTQAQ
jgi:tetratricopeptide (TPR) repeat protein